MPRHDKFNGIGTFDPKPCILIIFDCQLIGCGLFISGIVDRIFIDTVSHVRSRKRNYYHGRAQRPADEQVIQQVVGRIGAYRSAISATIDRAVRAVSEAQENRDPDLAHPRALAAVIAASEAKVVTDEISSSLAGNLLDVASGSGVSTEAGFDRHWLNIRVIAAHNPRIYKERLLGDYYLNGTLPPIADYF